MASGELHARCRGAELLFGLPFRQRFGPSGGEDQRIHGERLRHQGGAAVDGVGQCPATCRPDRLGGDGRDRRLLQTGVRPHAARKHAPLPPEGRPVQTGGLCLADLREIPKSELPQGELPNRAADPFAGQPAGAPLQYDGGRDVQSVRLRRTERLRPGNRGAVRPGRVHGQRGRADRFERNDRCQLPEQPEEPRPTVETARQCVGLQQPLPSTPQAQSPGLGVLEDFARRPRPAAQDGRRKPRQSLLRLRRGERLRRRLRLQPPQDSRPVHRLRAEHVPADRPPGLELPGRGGGRTPPREQLRRRADPRGRGVPLRAVVQPRQLAGETGRTLQPGEEVRRGEALAGRHRPLVRPPGGQPPEGGKGLRRVQQHLQGGDLYLRSARGRRHPGHPRIQ